MSSVTTLDKSPNQLLIGVPGSRRKLVTPALLLDIDILQENIRTKMRFMRESGLALRPHGKTHKSVNIAKLQIEAGAVGICTATVKEAQHMIGAGIPGVFLTTPVVGSQKLETISQLSTKASDFKVVVDNPNVVNQLSTLMQKCGASLEVLIDIDIGPQRTGVNSLPDILDLAASVDNATGLKFSGVQAYSGMVQHIEDYHERLVVYGKQLDFLKQACLELEKIGLNPDIVTGGGTGTFDIDRKAGIFTELQSGSYCVMDVQYNAVQLLPDVDNPFSTALFVSSSVISNNASGFVTADAGIKSFAMDGPPPKIAQTGPADAEYGISGDEHGKISFKDENTSMELGEIVELITPHCDPTVNLHNYFHCVRGDTLVDIWPVDGRGVI